MGSHLVDDLFSTPLDVCLCDGFVGNVILKSCEATAKAVGKRLKQALNGSPVRKIGALLAKGAFAELKDQMSADAHGGSPLLGVNGVVIIAHGGSSAEAICNAIRASIESVDHKVNKHISEALDDIAAITGQPSEED